MRGTGDVRTEAQQRLHEARLREQARQQEESRQAIREAFDTIRDRYQPIDVPAPVVVDMDQAANHWLDLRGFPLLGEPFEVARIETLGPGGKVRKGWPTHRGHCAGTWGSDGPVFWTFCGAKGTGKTYAARGVVVEEWKAGRRDWAYVSAVELAGELSGPRFGEGAPSSAESLRLRALRSPSLFLDDLVFKGASQQARVGLREILHTRQQRRARTIVTLHVGFARPIAGESMSLTSWDSMIAERLREGCVAFFVNNKRPALPDF